MASAKPAKSVAAQAMPAYLSPLSFQVPYYLEESAWLGHGAFAAWVIEATQPRVLVELGTHGGFSYFAFCQAVLAKDTGTQCYAVDHWQGDVHAGYYDESIYNRVNNHNQAHYSAFSRLVRSTFDDALEHFSDGSVDLLHIDGRHFYDDVKHDFETWIPKLSDRAVVLFHDINVRERQFGVYQLWESLRDQHPSFEFLHSHGLGVLGFGKKVPPGIAAFFDATKDPHVAQDVRSAYSRLGGVIINEYALKVAKRSADERETVLRATKERLTQTRRATTRFKRWMIRTEKRDPLRLWALRRNLRRALKLIGWIVTGRFGQIRQALGSSRRGRAKRANRSGTRTKQASARPARRETQATFSAAQDRADSSVAARTARISDYLTSIEQHALSRATQAASPRIVFYTAIIGTYDSLKLPAVLDPRADYVVFTDTPMASGPFEVRPATFLDADPTRTARWHKTHPHLLFPDHDIAIWLDANVMVLEDLSPLIDPFIESGQAIGLCPHPHRDNVWAEFAACLRQGRDDVGQLEQQEQHYRNQGYQGKDVFETCVMAINLRHDRTAPFLNAWWHQINVFSRRDQLSVGYALQSSKTPWHLLFSPPLTTRDHPLFAYLMHDNGEGSSTELTRLVGGEIIDPYRGPTFAEVKESRLADQHATSIDIVVCVHNALNDVSACLESLERHRSENEHVYLVDDCSQAPTRDFLAAFAAKRSWVSLIRNGRRRGYTQSANLGIAAGQGSLCILLNSDTIVTENWSKKMADALANTPGAGIVGPLSNAASHQSIPDHVSRDGQTAINTLPEGYTVDDMARWCEESTPAHVFPRVPLVHGFCMGINRDAIATLGLFDEARFPDGYGEEDDYCFRASAAGVGLVVATHTYVFHSKSKSYGNATRSRLARVGAETLRQLHGVRVRNRAVASVREHGMLARVRTLAAELYSGRTPLIEATPISTQSPFSLGLVTWVTDEPRRHLSRTASSIASQRARDLQWVIVVSSQTSPRNARTARRLGRRRHVKVIESPSHEFATGINAGIESLATEWVMVLRPGERLHEGAADTLASASSAPADIIYGDTSAHMLPEFSGERLLVDDYLSRTAVVRRQQFAAVGALNAAYPGAEMYDLVMRASETARDVIHLPHPILDVDDAPVTTAAFTSEVHRNLITDTLARRGESAEVTVTNGSVAVIRQPRDLPRVSVIIPTNGTAREVFGAQRVLAEAAIDSVASTSTYGDIEFVVVYDRDTPVDLLDRLAQRHDTVAVPYRRPFNFADKCNVGALAASGDVVVFLNDDTEVITPSWIETMLGALQADRVQAVGPLLRYENGEIQSTGHTARSGKVMHVDHDYVTSIDPTARVLFDRATERSGVTGACLMMRRDYYLELGGMDEQYFGAFNDVDLCYRILDDGHTVVWTPFAELYHFEHLTRAGNLASTAEWELIRRNWGHMFSRDPFVPLP